MRCKWNFRNEPTLISVKDSVKYQLEILPPNFSEIPAFRLKSGWKPPKGHASLEVFLSRVERAFF